MKKTLVVFCVVVILILASLATAGTPAIEKGSAAMWFNFNGLSDMSYQNLSLIHISEPTRLLSISYAVFCLKKKNYQLLIPTSQ